MALWLLRAGRHGEHEQKFLDSDLGVIASRKDLQDILRQREPEAVEGKIVNHSGQIWAFVRSMKPGDWVVVPSKKQPALNFAEIVGDYHFEASAPDPYHHVR